MLLCACDPHRFEREQIIFGKSWEELGTLIKMPAEHVDRSNMQNQIIIQIRQNFQPPPFFFFLLFLVLKVTQTWLALSFCV